jgi:hypothetical protein
MAGKQWAAAQAAWVSLILILKLLQPTYRRLDFHFKNPGILTHPLYVFLVQLRWTAGELGIGQQLPEFH